MKMTRLIPMLPVRNMQASAAFYQKLGFGIEHQKDEWRWANSLLADWTARGTLPP
jgi:predicted lactoylglutathione lyase